MKGQNQALTAILITFVTIGAIGIAYEWGVPLLEKQERQAELSHVEQDVFKLHRTIISTSQAGAETTRRVQLDLRSGGNINQEGSLVINEKQDYIQIETTSLDPPYPENTWTLLKGDTLQNLTVSGAGSYGIKGKNLPGVVAVKVPSSAEASIVRYRIEFRNLKTQTTPSKIEKIDLTATGNTRASGEVSLLINNKGVERDSNIKIGSENLDRVRRIIQIDIQ